MTPEEFEAKVGRPPTDDDLERVNCPLVGTFGHWWCGWCEICDKPRFETGCPHGDCAVTADHSNDDASAPK